MLTHRRRLLWFVVEAGIASTASAPALAFDDAAFCGAARQFALAASKDAGLWIDRIVRNDGMAVSCTKRTVEFRRSINAGSAFLTANWKDRKSEEWNAAHCNSPIWAEAVRNGWMIMATFETSDGVRVSVVAQCKWSSAPPSARV